MRAPNKVAGWLVPSLVGGCLGGVVGGIVDAIEPYRGVLPLIVVIGLSAAVLVPLTIIVSLIARIVAKAWPVRTDASGAAPELAAWTLVLWAGAVALAAAMFHGTWLLRNWTQFKPLVVGLAEPGMAVATVIALVAVSRPVARLLAAGLVAVDDRWRSWHHARTVGMVAGAAIAALGIIGGDPVIASACVVGGALVALRAGSGSLLAPARVGVLAGVLVIATGVFGYRWIIRPKFTSGLDLTGVGPGCAALVTCWLVHLAWSRWPIDQLRRRRRASQLGVVIALAVVGAASVLAVTRADLALRVWGEPSIAGRMVAGAVSAPSLRARMTIAAPVARGEVHPSVVLVTLDGVRADRMLGMPVLHNFAERGVTFDRAFAASNGPRRSLASIAFGLAANRTFDPRAISMCELFQAAGYATSVIAHADDVPAAGVDSYAKLRSAAALGRLREQLARRDRPQFVWIDLNEAVINTPYDKGLTAADAILAGVLAEMPRDAIVVVTSAYGYSLGEHGRSGYGTGLYNGVVHVPLVIAGPGIQPHRTADTVSLVDVAATLVDLAGFEPPERDGLDGRSLRPLLAGGHRTDARSGIAPLADDRMFGIVVDDFKLLQTGGEIYDLRTDPDERINLKAKKPPQASELREKLDDMLARERVSPLD